MNEWWWVFVLFVHVYILFLLSDSFGCEYVYLYCVCMLARAFIILYIHHIMRFFVHRSPIPSKEAKKWNEMKYKVMDLCDSKKKKRKKFAQLSEKNRVLTTQKKKQIHTHHKLLREKKIYYGESIIICILCEYTAVILYFYSGVCVCVCAGFSCVSVGFCLVLFRSKLSISAMLFFLLGSIVVCSTSSFVSLYLYVCCVTFNLIVLLVLTNIRKKKSFDRRNEICCVFLFGLPYTVWCMYVVYSMNDKLCAVHH